MHFATTVNASLCERDKNKYYMVLPNKAVAKHRQLPHRKSVARLEYVENAICEHHKQSVQRQCCSLRRDSSNLSLWIFARTISNARFTRQENKKAL